MIKTLETSKGNLQFATLDASNSTALLESIAETLQSVINAVGTIGFVVDNMQRKFEVEKAAKNKAYCYIIESGLIKAFQSWSATKHPQTDWHNEIIKELEKQSK